MKQKHVNGIQLNIRWRDKQANFAQVSRFVANEAAKKLDLAGSLWILPEMFATGFDVGQDAMAEGHSGELEETAEFLSSLARKYGIWIQGSGVSLSEESSSRGPKMKMNLVQIYDPNGHNVLTYQKVHPFSYGGEDQRFTSGHGAKVFDWDGMTVCPVICYDLRFPELFRQGIGLGAQMFTVVANWPKQRQAHWAPLLRARAIENQAIVIGVNRCGRDQFHQYRGESLIFDHYGERLAVANHEEQLIQSELDLVALKTWRKEFSALEDMKINSFKE